MFLWHVNFFIPGASVCITFGSDLLFHIVRVFTLRILCKSINPRLLMARSAHVLLPPNCTQLIYASLFLCSLQATMLKKSKIKRRNTEPSILPANEEGGKSTDE